LEGALKIFIRNNRALKKNRIWTAPTIPPISWLIQLLTLSNGCTSRFMTEKTKIIKRKINIPAIISDKYSSIEKIFSKNFPTVNENLTAKKIPNPNPISPIIFLMNPSL
jgi:hypothetical protein